LPVPTASTGGPYTIGEGGSLTLDGSGSSSPGGGPLTYSWDINGDDVFGDASGVNPTLSWAQLNALGINDGPATLNLRVMVTNGQGDSALSPVTTLTVNEAPPTSVQIVNPSISSGGQVSFTATASGPTLADQGDGYTFTINWGDGTAQSPDLTTIAVSSNNGNGVQPPQPHTYAPGIYTLTVTATEDGGQSTSTTALIVVGATAGDSITLGGSGAGQVAVTTTDEGNFTTTLPLDQVLVAGSGGSETYTVNFGSMLTTPITLSGGGTASGDTLIANGDSSPTNIINKTSGQVTWGNPVTETVLDSGIPNTVVNANGTTQNYVNDPGGSTTINGGPGANTITITATTGSGVVIHGGASANTYIVDLGRLAAPVTIQNNHSAATNSLTVNGAPGNNTITAAGNQVTSGTQTITDTAPDHQRRQRQQPGDGVHAHRTGAKPCSQRRRRKQYLHPEQRRDRRGRPGHHAR
jgi:hypothetical protein